MLTSYLLTTVDKVKKFMNLPSDVGNTNDAILLSMIRQKSNEIENYLNRKIRLQTFTEFYDGDGTNVLQLRNYPVSSITSLNIDTNRDFATTTVVDSDNYDLDSRLGRIIAAENLMGQEYCLSNRVDCGGIFPKALNSIKVVYVAGFNSFLISDDVNDTIEWNNGSAQSATLTAGEYTGSSLASHIQTLMIVTGKHKQL